LFQRLIEPNHLSQNTKFVLLTTSFLKASWVNEFDPADTATEPFHGQTTRDEKIMYMHGVKIWKGIRYARSVVAHDDVDFKKRVKDQTGAPAAAAASASEAEPHVCMCNCGAKLGAAAATAAAAPAASAKLKAGYKRKHEEKKKEQKWEFLMLPLLDKPVDKHDEKKNESDDDDDDEKETLKYQWCMIFAKKSGAAGISGAPDAPPNPREFSAKSFGTIGVPKFFVEGCDVDLRVPLETMGVKALFGSDCDLKGLYADEKTAHSDIYVSAIRHRCIVAIDEKGCEAAAATAVLGQRKCRVTYDIDEFVLNTSFVWWIACADVKTNTWRIEYQGAMN
jgi:hypothetical protein